MENAAAGAEWPARSLFLAYEGRYRSFTMLGSVFVWCKFWLEKIILRQGRIDSVKAPDNESKESFYYLYYTAEAGWPEFNIRSLSAFGRARLHHWSDK